MYCADVTTILLVLAATIGITWLLVAAYFMLRYRFAIANDRYFNGGLHKFNHRKE